MDIKKEWGKFGDIVLNPWVACLILAAILFNVLLVNQTDTAIIAALSVIVTLISGVLGGVATKRWLDQVEGTVIVARGKTAVRSLKLLLGSIVSLEKRVRAYLSREKERPEGEVCTRELLATEFEEVIGKCVRMEEEVISSIENWTDIVPEGDIKTQIGEWTKLKMEVERQNAQMTELQNKLKQEKSLSKEEKEQLRHEINRLQAELSQHQLSMPSWLALNYATDTGLPSGATGPSGLKLDIPDNIFKQISNIDASPYISLSRLNQETEGDEKDG